MFTENLATFFADFGVNATLGGVAVRGVFDNGFVDAGGLGAYGTAPVFTCPTAVLAGVAVGGAATIQGTDYTIVGIEPDGTGMSLVRLERV